MPNIAEIDKNFKIETNVNKSDVKFYNALTPPFRIYGIFYEDGKFRRMPESVARTVSEGVHSLHANTAGGRLRFKTNSPYIAINVKMPTIGKMSHFALCGSSGFDLYINGTHRFSFLPPFNVTDGYEGIVDLGSTDMKDVLINFPLYSDVSELFIGLAESADVLEPAPYKIEKPIVYYGSSITQGGCASRPGTAYQGFISRELDANFINLGFSGGARAEEPIANYIKTLDMSVFVYDYDHNAPTAEFLEKTHEKMFLMIREANPSLPIILMTMPKAPTTPSDHLRHEIIKRTYDNALARGDRNVRLITGAELTAISGTEGTVDTVHPTDLGFFSMAKAVTEVLKEIL